jgi:hypothetical protein
MQRSRITPPSKVPDLPKRIPHRRLTSTFFDPQNIHFCPLPYRSTYQSIDGGGTAGSLGRLHLLSCVLRPIDLIVDLTLLLHFYLIFVGILFSLFPSDIISLWRDCSFVSSVPSIHELTSKRKSKETTSTLSKPSPQPTQQPTPNPKGSKNQPCPPPTPTSPTSHPPPP